MSLRRKAPIALVAGLALVLSGLVGRATPVARAQIVVQPGAGVIITTTGPLSEIDISNVGTIQVVDNRVSSGGEFYPSLRTGCGASHGVGVVIGTIYYGPDPKALFNCKNPSTGAPDDDFYTPDVAFQPISQTASGSGTAASPYIVVTTVGLTTGLTLTETITYVTGQSSFREDVSLQNTSGAVVMAKIYNMSEPDPGSKENGVGYRDPVSGTIGGYNPQNPTTGTVYECSGTVPPAATGKYYVLQQPITPFSHFTVSGFDYPFRAPHLHVSYSDTANTSCQDLGVGGEWDVTEATYSTVTVSKFVDFVSSAAGQVPPTVGPNHGGTFNGAAQCNPPTPPNSPITCGASQNPPHCPSFCAEKFGANAFCTTPAAVPGGFSCSNGTGAGGLGGASYYFHVTSGGVQPAGPCTAGSCPDGGTITFYGRGVYNAAPATFRVTASDDDVNLTDTIQMTVTYAGGSITAYWTCSPATAGNCAEVTARP